LVVRRGASGISAWKARRPPPVAWWPPSGATSGNSPSIPAPRTRARAASPPPRGAGAMSVASRDDPWESAQAHEYRLGQADPRTGSVSSIRRRPARARSLRSCTDEALAGVGRDHLAVTAEHELTRLPFESPRPASCKVEGDATCVSAGHMPFVILQTARPAIPEPGPMVREGVGPPRHPSCETRRTVANH